MNNKLTIIIPTRERCDTLEWTLKTCIEQDYDNLEILISDNYSKDQTQEVVRTFNDSRIKYVNTGKRISMSHNFEFGLSNVNDGYVMFLGDDDGLLPQALIQINKIINETEFESINWNPVNYFWPDYSDVSLANLISIPLRSGNKILKLFSEPILKQVSGFSAPYTRLPQIYTAGIVSYKIINRIKNNTGVFFRSMTPDVYAAVAIASTIEEYAYIDKPFTLKGSSSRSNSNSMSHGYVSDVPHFESEGNLPFHHELEYNLTTNMLVWEALLQARDAIPRVNKINVDAVSAMKIIVQEASGKNAEVYKSTMASLEKVAKKLSLETYFTDLSKIEHHFKGLETPALGMRLFKKALWLNGAEFSVRNVYEASQLSHHCLVLEQKNYNSWKNALLTQINWAKKLKPSKMRKYLEWLLSSS